MNQVAEKLSVDGILADWEHGIKPVVMKEWGETDKEVLVELFGKVRDEWIERDLHGWIGANRYVSVILFLFISFHGWLVAAVSCLTLVYMRCMGSSHLPEI
jgi:hypothetical protein